jgi:hypothetical protein
MGKLACALALTGAMGISFAADAAVGEEAPAADQPSEVKATAAAATKDPAAAEFKPPPGFKVKKRGELILYCMRDSTVGTRFKTEKCYDEAQLRDYIVAQEENKRDIDRVRNTCSTGTEWCQRQ